MGLANGEVNILWNQKTEYDIPFKVDLQPIFGG
jgi:hypothetical protein